MPTKEQLLHSFHQKARLARTLHMTLSFDEQDRAVVDMPYDPAYTHALGGTHGGIIATLLDIAGWFTAALTHPGDGWVATTELSLHLLRPAKDTALRARGELLHRGKRLDVAEMKCWDEEDNLVAHATGTFVYLEEVAMGKR